MTELETRKPRLSLRYDDVNQSRFADRQYWDVLYQPPPRFTRSEPVDGPVGSVLSDVA